MGLSTIQWIMTFGTIVLQIGIAVAMVRLKSRRTFPFFFNFVIFSLLTLVFQAALVRHMSPVTYFFQYWTTMALSTLFSFAVMYEVFVHILRPYSALVDFGKLLFKWAIGFLALASVITAFATNGTQAIKLCSTIRLLDRSSDLMQCGLLLLLMLFESRLGLSWRSPAICIMVGFGANAALFLSASYLSERFPALAHSLDLATAVASVVVYACWFASFILPMPARRTVQDSPTRLILQRWNEALMATPLVSRKNQIAVSPVESFLPGVEQTVERVMARKMMH